MLDSMLDRFLRLSIDACARLKGKCVDEPRRTVFRRRRNVENGAAPPSLTARWGQEGGRFLTSCRGACHAALILVWVQPVWLSRKSSIASYGEVSAAIWPLQAFVVESIKWWLVGEARRIVTVEHLAELPDPSFSVSCMWISLRCRKWTPRGGGGEMHEGCGGRRCPCTLSGSYARTTVSALLSPPHELPNRFGESHSSRFYLLCL